MVLLLPLVAFTQFLYLLHLLYTLFSFYFFCLGNSYKRAHTHTHIGHQKVVEMAPSQNLPEVVRQKILADAIAITKYVKYYNAGTVEFLYNGASEKHYFIEVNPRVQVEHTVTEQVSSSVSRYLA